MNREAGETKRRRLSFPSDVEREVFRELYPVKRAVASKPGNVYYLPVSGFPIPEPERTRVKTFIHELQSRHAQTEKEALFNCMGIINSVLEFEVLEKVSLKNFDWRPQMAIALIPGQPPPHMPTREEAMSWQEGFPVHDVMPMVTYITKQDAVAEAHDELFGCGGTALYVSPLQSKQFFEKTKEIFGYNIKDKCFQLMECLPVFRVNHLLDAAENQLRALHSTISLYIGESVRDKGVVISSLRSLDELIADLTYLLKPEPGTR